MTFYIYGLKNRLLGLFENPISDDKAPSDYLDGISLSLVSCDVNVLARYKEFDVYHLGTFDSKSGEVKPCLDFLGSLEPICLRLIEHKSEGVSDHGEK